MSVSNSMRPESGARAISVNVADHVRRGRLAALLCLGTCLAGAVPLAARAQTCDQSQVQLTQAIVDSQTALDRIDQALNGFGGQLIAPRSEAIDATQAVAARDRSNEFTAALDDFGRQVAPLADACGAGFNADVQTLHATIDRFRAQQARAEQLLADHQALLDSGEPPLTQADMEAVQRGLAATGFYQQPVDGRFGSGTRAAIRSYQAARGYPATGYLTAGQLQELMAAAETGQPQQTVDVVGLPPAPTTEGQPAPVEPVSDEARAICAANVAQLSSAVDRTRDYREELNPRVGDLRTMLRGPRIPAFDAAEGSRIAGGIDSYLDQLDVFHDQAEQVAGLCGDEYDVALASLGNQVDSLRSVQQRAEQISRDYDALVASGEPAMSREEMVEVQQGLQALGHYSGGIDALFGPGTRNAIRSYQAAIGASQTGYLTGEQIADLRGEAVRPAVTPVAESDSEPTPAALPAGDVLPAVRAHIVEAFARPVVDRPLSGIDRGDGGSGVMWWRLSDGLANGDATPVIEDRQALMGAVYFDHGADSPEMVDAHQLIAAAYASMGLYGDAQVHLEMARETWTGLDRDRPAELAAILERLASARLAQVVAGSEKPTGADVEAIKTLLVEARSAAEEGGADGVGAMAIDRMADLHAAAGRTADDAEVAAALRARYAM
ncbi:MAG: peptidoglycan-binding domain-containing protein [Alphaproteobacteria bacterium]